MAETLKPNDYGWFTPDDLKMVIEGIHQLEDWRQVILVGGQSLTAWVQYFQIELPPIDGPYLTADADFLGSKVEAGVIARHLKGTTTVPGPDDHTPNTALIEFTGESGKKLIIDMLTGILGVSTEQAKRLAVPVQLADCKPIQVLHPLLVLESRCHNLKVLSHKRTGNGITQARVSCQVATRYLRDCLTTPERHREALNAAKRIADLAQSQAGVFVWKEWKIDVMEVVIPAEMPGQFPRSWEFEKAETNRKREIAMRLTQQR